MEHIKIARTEHEVAEFIKNRWSPRAFSEQQISNKNLMQLLEAARWAPSANNEQPWLYLYAQKGTEGFDKICESLSPGNIPWAKNASILVVAMVRKTFEANGKENPFSWHDLGMANANLMTQATTMGIYSHFMAGLDKEKLSESLMLQPDHQIVGLLALGYPASADILEEPYKTRELTERTRKPVDVFARAI